MKVLGVLLCALLVAPSMQELPPGCSPLNQQPFSTFDVRSFWEANNELSGVAPLRWMGSWRPDYAVPTQHFAINQVKPGNAPMRLGPYSANMDRDGIAYDASTLDRWSDPSRSDLMLQQTPNRQGAPWDKVRSVGSNMKQMTTGPDGNPTAAFTGKSGLRVGFPGISEPTWTSFGDMYADFTFTGNGGRMEVPLVRGSALLTHHFENANPLVAPFCLSRINDKTVSYECPVERNAADGGSGFLEGTCSGNQLLIILRATKAVELSQVQWAANTASDWPTSHPMLSCGSECTISEDGLTVDIRAEGGGDMRFAVNVIGRYIIPNDWVSNPKAARCTRVSRAKQIRPCETGICHNPSCDSQGGSHNIQIVVDLDQPIAGLDQIQFAASPASSWGYPSPMLTCNNPAISCTLSADNRRVTYSNTFNENSIKYATNLIGRSVHHSDWVNNPYEYGCGDPPVTNPPSGPTQPPTAGPGEEIDRGRKFIFELDEPNGKLPSQTRKFILYFSSDVIASVYSDGQIYFQPVSGGNYNGLLQVAYAGASPRSDRSGTDYFDEYAGVFPYRSRTSFCTLNDKGYISFDWEKHDINGPTTTGKLLMITMPHHEALLSGGSGVLVDTPFVYKGYTGDSWLLEEDLPLASMEPSPEGVARVKADPEWHQNVLTAIARDTAGQDLPGVCRSSNSYGVGKAIYMVARLASISRAFETNHFQTLDAQIRECLEKWLRIDDTLSDGNKFRYDTYLGGLLLRSGPADQPINPNANFGFPMYSDHHFHLGYHIYAAAYYSLYYPNWADAHRERLVALARDVANPSVQDNLFPIVRHKDFYVGISWATGLVGGIRQAESSTEAIACYHGVAALGLALNIPSMKQTGQLMLATEIRSVREYYHVRAHNRHNFPPILRDYGAIGMFSEESTLMYTLNWPCDPVEFPMRHACLVGIQIIPITSISYLYQDQEWAGAIRNVCTWSINPFQAPGAELVAPGILRPVNLGWGAFCHSAMAPYSAQAQQAAADYVKDLTPGQLVGGTGAASTLLFIYAST